MLSDYKLLQELEKKSSDELMKILEKKKRFQILKKELEKEVKPSIEKEKIIQDLTELLNCNSQIAKSFAESTDGLIEYYLNKTKN